MPPKKKIKYLKSKGQFFIGKKKASEEQRREYIRDNFSKINPDKLAKDDRAYYGRVKGGKNRQKAAPRIEGKFISEKFIQEHGLNEIAKSRGYRNAKTLLKNDPELYETIKNIYSNEGQPHVLYSGDVFSFIDSFNGKIFINNEEVAKVKCIEKTDFIDKYCVREFDAFMVQYNVLIKKGNELHFDYPENIREYGDDVTRFIEENDGVEPLFSDKAKLSIKESNEKKLQAVEDGKNKKRFFQVIVRGKDSNKKITEFVGTKKQVDNYAARFLNSDKYKTVTDKVKKTKPNAPKNRKKN